ncbi:carbohydrate-binding protein [Streptosporangium sp. NPDC023825]|uniref:carbohydrate-binding protein n=1 Tax=Streptosporangium sp. NPDC023825 TaxID=3154909 RepID=UPI00342F4CC4
MIFPCLPPLTDRRNLCDQVPTFQTGHRTVRCGRDDGKLVVSPSQGSVAVSPTGGGDTYATVSTTLSGSASGPLYLVFVGSGTNYLFDIDTFTVAT